MTEMVSVNIFVKLKFIGKKLALYVLLQSSRDWISRECDLMGNRCNPSTVINNPVCKIDT